MTTVDEMPAGFADKVLSAQSTFRSVMDAMARPGSFQRIAAVAGAPGLVMRGTAAVALTLFDHDTPVWLNPEMSGNGHVTKWLKFHTGAPVIADSSICMFALIGEPRAMPPLDRFSFGTSEYPDCSTTLIVQVESLTQGLAYELRGPGIDGAAQLLMTFEPADLFERLAVNVALFPRGVDLILVADDSIVAIPRTTRCVAKGA